MDTDNQLESDRERLASLVSKYTGIPSKRVYDFVAENGAGEILPSANRLAATSSQRERLNNLFEFRNLYEIVKGTEKEKAHTLSNTNTAMGYFKNFFADKNDRERVAVAFLDSQNKVKATKIMSEGTINESSMPLREIAREALFHNAVTVILAHNHPSGDKQPSILDIDATEKVMGGLNAVGVRLCDHIIVTGSGAISMADLGFIVHNDLGVEMSKAASPVREETAEYGRRGNGLSNDNATAAEIDTLREFDVEITETLQKTVTVEAADRDDAERIVEEQWKNSEYILDADNLTGVGFEASTDGREPARGDGQREEGGNNEMDTANANTPQNDNIAPLSENRYVQELFSILGDNGKDTTGLAALLGHVSEMESFVKRAEDKIAEMKSQLAEMKEVQNHPVKTALQNAIKTLERKVAEVKEHLGELKAGIIEGCKNAVAAFKEKGAAVLNNLASFFKVRDNLEGWKKNINSTIRIDNAAIAKIEAFSVEYHSVGRHFKNMARVAVGKDPVDTQKEAGKLAKALSAPYKAQKSVLVRLQGKIDKAIAQIEKLDTAQSEKKAERAREKKPSMLAKLEANKGRVEQAKRESPIPERAKAKGIEV